MNVISCVVVPAEGTNAGSLKVNVPGTLATPPSSSTAADRAWPSIRIDDCGNVVIVGVALAIVKSIDRLVE